MCLIGVGVGVGVGNGNGIGEKRLMGARIGGKRVVRMSASTRSNCWPSARYELIGEIRLIRNANLAAHSGQPAVALSVGCPLPKWGPCVRAGACGVEGCNPSRGPGAASLGGVAGAAGPRGPTRPGMVTPCGERVWGSGSGGASLGSESQECQFGNCAYGIVTTNTWNQTRSRMRSWPRCCSCVPGPKPWKPCCVSSSGPSTSS